MRAIERVGLDSDALTFLVEAMSGDYDPANDPSGTAVERVAMFRIFLHADHPLCLTPTVQRQYDAISCGKRHRAHWDVHQFHLCDAAGEVPSGPDQARVSHFRSLHSGSDDCIIAAEGEAADLTLLLSRDADFARRLNPALRGLKIERPSAYWNRLAIPMGARPRCEPAAGNPVLLAAWWKW